MNKIQLTNLIAIFISEVDKALEKLEQPLPNHVVKHLDKGLGELATTVVYLLRPEDAKQD